MYMKVTAVFLTVISIVVLLYVLFVLYCSTYCLCVNVYCHRVTTQLQLTNISYQPRIQVCLKNWELQFVNRCDCALYSDGRKRIFFLVSELPADCKYGVPELDHPRSCSGWGDSLPTSWKGENKPGREFELQRNINSLCINTRLNISSHLDLDDSCILNIIKRFGN